MDQPHHRAQSSTAHQHARPHIETHTRSQKHSAVGGAAYRLGLKLPDERTGKWHDFHRRSLRGEIILALTLAPDGSPAWATQPQELWNRVEASETRKDAQLARDYRIPVPLGLALDQANVLAQQMARFISDALKTPVSVGVHRDSKVDVLGEKKASEKVGYHVHLYFPTRRLACFEESGKKSEELTEAEATGFGSKLTLLSNKRTSAEFVEMLNKKWAELSNQVAGSNGLRADYDHRSYARQGVDITPQPTVGQCATAMEREGMETRKGNQLREALKPSEKISDINAEANIPSATPAEISSAPPIDTVLPPSVPAVPAFPVEAIELDFSAFKPGSNIVFLDKLREHRNQQDPLGVRSSHRSERAPSSPGRVVPFPSKQTSIPLLAVVAEKPSKEREHSSSKPPLGIQDKVALETLIRKHGLVVTKTSSIAARLEKSLPSIAAPSEKERVKQSLVVVEFLQNVLAVLDAAREDEEKKAVVYERARAAAVDADVQIDKARHGRHVAQNRLNLWMRNRPRPYGLIGIIDPGKRKREELQADVCWKDDLVQSAKRGSERLHLFSKEALRVLLRVQAVILRLKRDLAVAAVDLRSRHPYMFEEFSRWISLRERKLLEEAMPGPTDSGLEVEGNVDVSGASDGASGSGSQRGVLPVNKPAPRVLPELGKLKR